MTATITSGGSEIQRYVYTPSGVQTVLTGAFATSSAANSIDGFQGGRVDIATGMNHFGRPGRDYDPATGGWIRSDLGYFSGLNLYWADAADPINNIDPSGNAPASTQPTTNPSPIFSSNNPSGSQTINVGGGTLDLSWNTNPGTQFDDAAGEVDNRRFAHGQGHSKLKTLRFFAGTRPI